MCLLQVHQELLLVLGKHMMEYRYRLFVFIIPFKAYAIHKKKACKRDEPTDVGYQWDVFSYELSIIVQEQMVNTFIFREQRFPIQNDFSSMELSFYLQSQIANYGSHIFGNATNKSISSKKDRCTLYAYPYPTFNPCERTGIR